MLKTFSLLDVYVILRLTISRIRVENNIVQAQKHMQNQNNIEEN